MITYASDFKEEAATIIKQIQALLANDVRSQDICITARTKHAYERYASALNDAGIETYNLGQDSGDSDQRHGVRMATMHRIKGLEFQYVFLAGINDGVVPEAKAISSDDPVEQRDALFNERALLHVAATRAVKRVICFFIWRTEYITNCTLVFYYVGGVLSLGPAADDMLFRKLIDTI